MKQTDQNHHKQISIIRIATTDLFMQFCFTIKKKKKKNAMTDDTNIWTISTTKATTSAFKVG